MNTAEVGTTTYHGQQWAGLQPRWLHIVIYATLHLACVAAPFFFTWSGLALCLLLYAMCGGLGITLCYHRLITHRSFATFRPLKHLLCMIGCTNLLDGPMTWAGVHRIHHANAEEEHDPHTTFVGFWWAHFEWFFFRPPQRPYDYCRDLARDRGIALIERLYYLFPSALAITLFAGGYALGAWPTALSWLLWGGVVRTVLVFHSAGLVNSATHMWGYRNFDLDDNSRNLLWVAILTFGEGWHNNHHAQPRSAAHGMAPGELDLAYALIKLLNRMGLVWGVVRPEWRDSSHPQRSSE